MAKTPTIFLSWTLAVASPLRYWKVEKLAGIWTLAVNPVIYINPGDVGGFYTLNAGSTTDGTKIALDLAHSDSTSNFYGDGSATPVTNNITSAESSNYTAPSDGVWNSIYHAGFYYLLAYDTNTQLFQVLKSSTGNSPWTVLDSANALQLGAAGSSVSIKGTTFVVQSFFTGSSLYIAELDISAGSPAWNYVANGDYSVTTAQAAGPSPQGAEAAGASTGLHLFDNGKVGFMYRKAGELTTLYYRLFTPGGIGTLGPEVTIQANANPAEIGEITQLFADISNDQVYILTKYYNGLGSFEGWQYRTLAEDGTTGAVIQQFPSPVPNVLSGGMGHASIVDGNLYIPFVPGGAAPDSVYYVFEGVAGAVLSKDPLPVPAVEVGNPPDAQAYSLDWSATVAVLSIVCPVGAGTATVGVPFGPFDLTSSVTGGTGPFTFVITGTLPPGITLVGSILSGTPTTQGTYSYTITVTDSLGATATTDPGCSIVVVAAPPPEMCITAPAPTYHPTLVVYPDPVEQTGS